MNALAIVTLVAGLLAGCGGKSVFRLSADENNPYALGQALARRTLPAQLAPVGGGPRVYAVLAGKAQKTLIAFDLTTGAAAWKADGELRSRVAVGGDFVVALEGTALVAREAANGAIRWRAGLPGTFVGHAADRERVYAVYQDDGAHWLVGFAGDSGAQLWKADAAGKLGAPAAHGGVVYVPFLSQWLSLVDGKTGAQLTRIRGIESQISSLRVTSQAAYYGSKQGLFQLDVRSASGKRADAAYGQITVPAELERTSYARDMYDPVQAGYSAFDRARVLFTTAAAPAPGPLRFGGDTYAVHYFRYVFGFGADGTLSWAYNHPRVELVASEHTGSVIAGVSSTGEVVALDPATGAVRAKLALGTAEPVLGATFDADGWAPVGQAAPAAVVATLVGIVRDPDARFDRVKELAVTALARRPEPSVTAELLAILADGRVGLAVKDRAVALLVERRDPQSLPTLVAGLGVTADYLAQSQPEALGSLAKTIAGLGGTAIDAASAQAAVAALAIHLDAPSTPSADLALVITAMAAVGGGAERAALGSHFLLYTPTTSSAPTPRGSRRS